MNLRTELGPHYWFYRAIQAALILTTLASIVAEATMLGVKL
jgi:hypothetical protein